MKRRSLLKGLATAIPTLILKDSFGFENLVSREFKQPFIQKGPFKANWQSLAQYQTPDWYRNAKFGIWAHWGPQCVPEFGDWYARFMYDEGSSAYNYHIKKYGHPSKVGFKDIINQWKAENWDPDHLVGLYKDAGAQYFMAMANHHDNLDLYNSKHQKWNTVNVGPKKDIIGGWADAAKKHNLPFGVSVHAAHAWSWMETAQRADKKGEFAGIPYDGKLTRADGKGQWWQGMDPQELYVQQHSLSEGSDKTGNIHKQWDWANGASIPDAKYCEKFLNRTIDLIDKYNPEIIYFDDTALPLWPISDVGLKIAAHYYNTSIKRNNGKLKAVINGKILSEEQRKCMVWDIERGASNRIEPFVWQTCTCLGNWHYDKNVFDKHWYKNSKTVIHTLIDVVSKNGNFLLNIPVNGSGTIDTDERKVVADVTKWMSKNAACILETRPWKVFGEGPALEGTAPLTAQGFNEGKGKPFTAEDIRFTAKGELLYAIVMGWPKDGKITIKSLAQGNALRPEPINLVNTLDGKRLAYTRNSEGLTVSITQDKTETDYAFAIQIS